MHCGGRSESEGEKVTGRARREELACMTFADDGTATTTIPNRARRAWRREIHPHPHHHGAGHHFLKNGSSFPLPLLPLTLPLEMKTHLTPPSQPPHPPRCRPPHPHQRAHDAAAPAHPVAAAIPGLGPREDIRDLPPASDPAVPGRDMGCRQGVY
ncbi:hypothetical protein V498_09173 [Pseudogymnoascus sp. VKM F-4517 (FW-2822)]|nr:hypothetical protein V498_09173 [Pseudogymnoascus sp. VKM F-4517 (FW-2822)]